MACPDQASGASTCRRVCASSETRRDGRVEEAHDRSAPPREIAAQRGGASPAAPGWSDRALKAELQRMTGGPGAGLMR